MRAKNQTNLGKTLSYFLRHNSIPIGGLERGWAQIQNITSRLGISEDLLDSVVEDDSKGRFEFNPDHTMIRAKYGHSLDVDVDIPQETPPLFLWHGTQKSLVNSILSVGLVSGNPNQVHLSEQRSDALKVGRRHGSVVTLIRVAARWASIEGVKFYNPGNGIWMAPYVLPRYLKNQDPSDVDEQAIPMKTSLFPRGYPPKISPWTF